MGYIQNEEHFVNFIQKAIKEEGKTVNLLSKDFYLNYIYRQGFADRFTWILKEGDLSILEEPKIWDWLQSQRRQAFRSDSFVHQFTDEFLKVIADLEGQPGVYSFWQSEGVLLYVGRSINLGNRLLGSFKRFHSYDRPIFARYIVTQSASDCVLLEAYFIATCTPPLNGADNYGDKLTVDLQPIPEWSEPVRCNWIINESDMEDTKNV